jgi:hypothetical protein
MWGGGSHLRVDAVIVERVGARQVSYAFADDVVSEADCASAAAFARVFLVKLPRRDRRYVPLGRASGDEEANQHVKELRNGPSTFASVRVHLPDGAEGSGERRRRETNQLERSRRFVKTSRYNRPHRRRDAAKCPRHARRNCGVAGLAGGRLSLALRRHPQPVHLDRDGARRGRVAPERRAPRIALGARCSTRFVAIRLHRQFHRRRGVSGCSCSVVAVR